MLFIQEMIQGNKNANFLAKHRYLKDCVRDIKEQKQDWLIRQLQKQILNMKETHDQEMGKAERKMGEKLDKLRRELKEKTKEIQDIKKQLKDKSDKIVKMDEEIKIMKSSLKKQLRDHQQGKKKCIKCSYNTL